MHSTLRKTYNVREIATILGISVPAAYNLAASEGFPSIRIGERRIVVPCEAFYKWMDEATKTPKA
jgi:predicted DNA-binding transcriptional regulator AlpA